MIRLKIKEAGHTIAIPGMSVFRSPVNLDISKLDIRIVSMYLKTSGITKYEIVAENNEGAKEVYTQKDFSPPKKRKTKTKKDSRSDARFEKLEKMMEIILEREVRNDSSNEEQIYNKLDKLEKLVKTGAVIRDVQKEDFENSDPEIEELDSFIPEVDISGMKLNSDNIKTVKQDSDELEDAADMLSGLTRRG